MKLVPSVDLYIPISLTPNIDPEEKVSAAAKNTSETPSLFLTTTSFMCCIPGVTLNPAVGGAGCSVPFTPFPNCATIALPSSKETIAEGIVIFNSLVSVSKPNPSPPIDMVPGATLFITITAIAPASCALFTLSSKLQAPLLSIAILPLIAAVFVSAEQASFVGFVASTASTNSPVTAVSKLPPKAVVTVYEYSPAIAAGLLIFNFAPGTVYVSSVTPPKT